MGNAESVLYRNIDINDLIQRKDKENKTKEYLSTKPENYPQHNSRYSNCWN